MSGCNFIKITVYIYNDENTFDKFCDSLFIVL